MMNLRLRFRGNNLCKRPGNEVTIIHTREPGSSLTPGYCLDCQGALLGRLLFIAIVGTVVVSMVIRFLFGI
jgi:hypothetical protein